MPVYFVQIGTDGPIKIGHARSLSGRLQQLRTDCPEPVTLIGQIDGGRDLEKSFHKKFFRYHRRGEWFNPASEILEFCKQIKNDPEEKNSEFEKIIIDYAKILGVTDGAIRQWRARKTVPHHIRFRLAERAALDGYELKHSHFESFGKDA